MFETTFSPIKIGSMTLKNRLLTSAMESVMSDPDGYVTDRYVNYIEARAKGGFGMVVTGMITVCRSGHGFRCCAANWDDSYIPGLSRLAEAVHKYEGAKLCMQIGHAGRQGRTRVTGLPTEAPTGLKDPTMADTPHELTTEEVKGLVKTFGQAALRAKKAGFDAVEVHAAHGYLVHGFFSPLSNKRTDCYGGNLHNRARFCCEIVEEIKKVCGKDFPVIVKISTTELEGSRLSIADTKAISMMLEEAGADCINATMGAYATPGYYPIVPPAVPHAFSVAYAEDIKRSVSIPVVTSGRYNEPYVIESQLRSGKADLVSMARQSLADPDFPNKMKAGQLDDIMHCIGCLQGCSGHLKPKNWDSIPITCLVNPRTGNEGRFDFDKKAEIPRKVAVAGGGIAGMGAAIAAARLGHDVTLYEASDKLGGQFLAAAVAPAKQERTTLVVWQKRQLDLLGVKVNMNTVLDAETAVREGFEVVIDAVGASPFVPNIPGVNGPNVTFAKEILMGKRTPGKKAVVIGGGQVGAETAEYLKEAFVDVTLIEMTNDIASDGFANVVFWIKDNLHKRNVPILTEATVKLIEENAVVYEKGGQAYRIDNVDDIILAVGSKPNKGLAADLEGKIRCITIGDAKDVRDALAAHIEAYEAAFSL